MMRKLFAFLLTCCGLQATPPQVELKLGYFHFGDPQFRKIYDQQALDTQLTASGSVWKWVRLYGGVNYISREGRSLGGHHRTKIQMVPLSLGVQAMVDVAYDVKYYFTLGPRYFFVHQSNHAAGIPSSINGNGLGGFANTGFQVECVDNLFIDLFGEYSYGQISFKSHRSNVTGHTRQVGGWTIGGGLGYEF